MTRKRSLSVLSLLTPALLFPALACAGPADDAPAAAGSGSATAAAEPEIVRTADPARRGLGEEDFPRVQQLAEGVYSYEALRSAGEERFTTVSLFVVTDEGVLVADGQGNPEETRRMVEAIAGVTSQPIRHVVVASDHGDHTGGNSSFPEGVTFYAHPTSAAALEASAESPNREADAPAVRLAGEIVEDRRVLQLGGKEIEILHLGRAHTGGDLSVYLPAERVLFMSEAYLNRVFPAMRSAYPSEWVEVIERAQAMDVEVYVPGHGFVETPGVLREELEEYRRALETVIAEATRLHAAGVGVEEAVEQASFGDLEDWRLRSSQGPIAVRRVYLELEGGLP
jgi:glyoxylase-like metal-dependent hydrolase (beta-lactamase superfamily II)